MLPLTGSNRLNYVYPLWLNLPGNYIITLFNRSQRQRGPKFILFKLTEGRRQEFLNLVIRIVLNLAWSYSKLRIKGKYWDRCPYVFFTLVTKVCFWLRIKQKWWFKMGPFCLNMAVPLCLKMGPLYWIFDA